MILTLMKKRKRVTTSVVTRVITHTRAFLHKIKSLRKSVCTPQVLTPPPQRCVSTGSGLCYVQTWERK
jgi:hypothetical protein